MTLRPPILYYKEHLTPHWYDQLMREIVWGTFTETRDECFQAVDHPRTYAYGSGRGVRTYHSSPVTPYMGAIFSGLRMLTPETEWYNVCFLNRYRDERQHLGWHSDDSPEIDQRVGIAVISFGAEREIWFQPKGNKGGATFKQVCHSGSMLVMLPGMQETWEHRIPKHSQPCGERISLTFRRAL